MLRQNYGEEGPARRVLRWSARGLSVVSIGLLLLFFVGEGVDLSRVSPREWVGLLLFPAGVAAGMVVAWRRAGAGGLITVGSLAAFYLYNLLATGGVPRGWAFGAFASPGFLFLAYWLLARKRTVAALPERA